MSNEHRAGSRRSWRPSWSQVSVLVSLPLCLVAWTALGLWIWPTPDPLPATPPALVFALGSAVRDDSTLSRTGAERVIAAVTYLHSSGSPRLITSRVRTRKGLLSDYGQRLIIVPAGIADRWTILDGVVGTTRDEVLFLRRIAAPGTRIAVVTSAFHTRRACAAFRHVGFLVTCLSSGAGPWWTTPYQAAYEMLGVIKYRWKGWI
jgi:uncharacterized SAM-binding protein YcdF (DUF218 family)